MSGVARAVRVRTRCLATAAVMAGALVVGGGAVRAQTSPLATPEYVVVQYDVAPGSVSAQSLEQRAPTLSDSGLRQLTVPPGKTREQFLAELRADPAVLGAEVEDARAVQAAFVPNDPYYAMPGQNQQVYLDQVGASQAWDLHTGSPEVVVAVLDSGLDLGHEEFAGRLWENLNDADSDGVDDDNNGCVDDRYGCRFINLDDKNAALCGYTRSSTGDSAYGDVGDDHAIPGSSAYHSHGTLVAGILGATGDNGKGVAGVAWNVKIMPVKVLDCGRTTVGGLPGGAPFNLAEGISYAVLMGADIINLSLAASTDFTSIRAAIANAQAAGVIVVTASGNASGGDVGVGYPGAYTEYTNVLAVGATNNQVSATSWASYSRYGPAVDFAAPANGLLTTARSDLGFSAPYFGTDARSAGTSFSTPIVAGVFALMISRNPDVSVSDLIQIARVTATPPTPAPHGQNWAGSGIINAGAALARIPMILGGEALHDWKAVPPETEVKAFVDGVECGRAFSQTLGAYSYYKIRVKASGESPECGAPGRTVQFMVGGAPAEPALAWGGRNVSLSHLDWAISSVTPPPGAVVVQTLNGGWSNVAVLDNSGALPDVLSSLPGWSTSYRWDPLAAGIAGPGAYDRYGRNVPAFVNTMTTLATFQAIWVDAPAGNVASLNPDPAGGRAIGLQNGWNNFVYTGTNREVKDALAGIAGKYTQVMQYDNGNLRWRIHSPGADRHLNDFGGLFKLQVYWIFMKQPATLSMN